MHMRIGEVAGEVPGLTAFGEWAATQPRGVLRRVQARTGLAWTTVSKAQHKLMSREVAVLLARCTGGVVKADQLTRPSRVALAKRSRADGGSP